jgi:rare lipoprotein A (peptidoglycan hydrolase)
VRTSFIVAASALIAVAVLVATAGPGAGKPAGTIEPLDSTAFTRVSLPPLDAATATPTPTPSSRATPAPSRPADLQPRLAVGPVVQPTPAPTWRTAEYSWYGPGFYGSGTACGQTYSKTILGVAHKTLPCGTKVTLRNPKNGRSITVRVIDRGPYVAGRMWDLSRATCAYLDNCDTAMIQYRLP